MDEAKFLELAKEVLEDIANDRDYTIVKNKIWPHFALYIRNNPNSQAVQWFRYNLLETYTRVFFNQALFDAFAWDDSISYYKQIQVFSNLPCKLHPNWQYYLSDLFEFPVDIPYDYYERFRYLLRNYYIPGFAEHPHMQSILDFTKANETLMRGGKDDYDILEREISLYKHALRGQNFKELEEFHSSIQRGSFEQVLGWFKNKKIGNIGELYVYNDLSKRFFSSFVSRDIKDGFGYDIYYYDWDNHIENLVEVKTTIKAPSDDDYFFTSKNELKVMQDTLGNPNARYLIVRVYLDSSLKPSYSTLTLKDSETLVDINNAEVVYKLRTLNNGEFCFMRQNHQKKIQYQSVSQ